jgi:AAA+ superfamily predicted ATPase
MRSKGQFWGQVVTDDEVDALLRAHGEIEAPISVDGLDDALAASTGYRDTPGGRFSQLRTAFQLDGDDADVLLLALAPEISAGYGRIFSYLNDNLSLPWLTVDLATRILRTERRARMAMQSRLLPSAPLIRNRLLLLHPREGIETHSAKRLYPASSLIEWLLGAGASLHSGARRLRTDQLPFVPQSAQERLDTVVEALRTPVTVVITGGTSGMREGIAIAVARTAEHPMVRVDLDRCTRYLSEPWDLVRDLQMDGSLPYLVNVPDTDEDPQLRLQVGALGAALAQLPYPIVIGGNERRAVATMLGADRPELTVPVGRASNAERRDAWNDAFERRGWDAVKAPPLAERFTAVGGTTIERVLERALAEAGGREPDADALWSAAREAARPEFSGLAQRIIPRYRWDDLILPDRIMGQLHHLEEYLAHQETVMNHWGGQKLRPRGYGIKALFSGGPGTGKTMCAEVIAGSLGLDLFKVDLSSVISRWVGETEKNLKEIFDAAEGGSSVILFDEADALFGSRGDVKSSQDRFANQEVSFLLQRLEVFEGCAILTTNLQENIDDAFLRRFGAVIEFPLPAEEERLRLWQRAIPEHAPRDPDLDLPELARQFRLAGGAIINASINACIRAAAEDAPVSMRHLVYAIARELYKAGKQVNRVHFGEWYDEVAPLFAV